LVRVHFIRDNREVFFFIPGTVKIVNMRYRGVIHGQRSARRQQLTDRLSFLRASLDIASSYNQPRDVLRPLLEEEASIARRLHRSAYVFPDNQSLFSGSSNRDQVWKEIFRPFLFSPNDIDPFMFFFPQGAPPDEGSVHLGNDVVGADEQLPSEDERGDINGESDEDDDSGVPLPEEDYESDDDLHTAIRLCVMANRFTADEIWACLMAVKIRHNLSDACILALGKFINMASRGEGPQLPTTHYGLRNEIEMSLPKKITFVAFCATCDVIVGSGEDRIRTTKCTSCNEDLTDQLKHGGAMFLVFNIREQLLGYLEDRQFLELLRAYGPHYLRTIRHIKKYREILNEGSLSLTMAYDAAPATRRSGVKALPLLLFLQQLPIGAQFRYPLLGAMFCSKGDPPSSKVMMKFAVDELRSLGTSEPLLWQDRLAGCPRSTAVYLTMCCTDAPQKAETCNHKGHGGTYSCLYCEMEGRSLNAEVCPDLVSSPFFDGNFTKQVKFPDLLHEVQVRRRENEDRVALGKEAVALKKAYKGGSIVALKKINVLGVKGLPAIRGLPKFENTWSHTSDLLHVAFEGIVKKLTSYMVDKTGKPHTFRSTTNEPWDYFHQLQDEVKKTSEMDHPTLYLGEFQYWKAIDFHNFLLFELAVLASDESIITDTEYYEMLVHLANVVYYLYHGRQTEELLTKAEGELRLFAESYKRILGPTNCTWKFHVFQHLIELARKHGPAFLWDAFMNERLLGYIVRDITTARLHVVQASRNFMLRNQSKYLRHSDKYV
jgi:hypothetical protein